MDTYKEFIIEAEKETISDNSCDILTSNTNSTVTRTTTMESTQESPCEQEHRRNNVSFSLECSKECTKKTNIKDINNLEKIKGIEILGDRQYRCYNNSWSYVT